jgi:hypothetical protein
MSRKNEFSRSQSRHGYSEDRRKLRDERPEDNASRTEPSKSLSADDINEQIRAFFARDLV